MPRSMTAFSRIEVLEADLNFTMELKSVNSKYCDVVIRAPRWASHLEDRMRKLIQERLQRGRIELSIQTARQTNGRATAASFEPDINLAKAYIDAAARLKEELGLDGAIDLPMLLNVLPGVVVAREEGDDPEKICEVMDAALDRLLKEFETMALEEGGNLQRDILARLDQIEAWVSEISSRSSIHFAEAKNALFKRIKAILKDVPVDESRLAQELAILADRLDITEELVRVASHIRQFKKLLSRDDAVGRRLDFLLQELFREINTIAVKSTDTIIAHIGVEIKGALEKIREQVQNIV
ncbi:MAG: YicC/YloC family endoribonuclease [Dissulfurimicrobium sp.]|uniref:YicC/YloC family endoribonuclease n=1 Tax=Dissulfurimicrobium sp. TaxID=2022436 RepID=UPI004049F471